MRAAVFAIGMLAYGLIGHPALDAEAADHALLVSSSSNRSNASALAEASVAGSIYVFVSPDTGVTRVRFFLDNPGMTGTPRQTENNAPFDFAGTAASGAAQPFNTAQVADGAHVITAALDLAAGGTEVVSATFTVANQAPALAWNPEGPVPLTVPEGGSTSTQVTLTATSGTAAFTLSETAAWLTVSPDSGATPAPSR